MAGALGYRASLRGAQTRDYRITRPLPSAVRAKNCDRCSNGWETFAREDMPTGAMVARAVRESSWDFSESQTTVAGAIGAGAYLPGEIDAAADPAQPVTVFQFAGGQACFQHPAPPRFFAGGREHVRIADWGDDLAEHLGKLNDQLKKG